MNLEEAREVLGFINSFESCGTVDGPGLRFVVFFQGCPLRCLYCHNPESWKYGEGRKMSAGEVLDEIKKYKNFMKVSGGGVTLSGGEPLTHPLFAEAILMLCKEEGIHTVVDTSGFIKPTATIGRIIDLTDLFLLDIKSVNASMHQILTGESNEKPLAFAGRLAERNKPMILRYVLVPDLNDRARCLEKLAKWAFELGNVVKVELLPFHKMGEFKWEQYGLPYRLTHTDVPSDEQVQEAVDIFRDAGLTV
jgi:pyruvate formate lyase activating enzyme